MLFLFYFNAFSFSCDNRMPCDVLDLNKVTVKSAKLLLAT